MIFKKKTINAVFIKESHDINIHDILNSILSNIKQLSTLYDTGACP